MAKQSVRLAIIDVGTLKSKFEIRDYYSPLHYKVIYKDKKLTVLGRDLPKTKGMIIDSAAKITIEALKEFYSKMNKYNVDRHMAVTTEALRKAKNADEILNRIKKESGIKLNILSHQDEAEIFFKHVSQSFKNKRIAVADIGGGSVQVVIGKDTDIDRIHLFKTGTYFMQEEFFETHSPTPQELKNAREYVRNAFKPLAEIKAKVDEIIYGSTNIIDFMKAMNIQLQPSNHPAPHPYRGDVQDLKKIYKEISPMKYEDRMDLYPDEPYYMWSADNALVNILELAEIFQLNSVIPTNENISSGLFRELHN